MISFLLYLLAAGALLLAYWLLDGLILARWASFLQRKWSIVAAVVLSLLLPVFFGGTEEERHRFDEEAYRGWQVVDISDATLRACYRTAQDSREVCRCEVEQKARMIVYEENDYYEFLLPLLPYLLGFWLIGALFVGGRLLWRIFGASRWILRQKREEVEDYQRGAWWRLRTQRVAVAAVWSWGNRWFLLWGAGMDSLKAAERQAVCRHEWAHLRQRDTWLNVFWQLAQSLLWWLPAFYSLRRRWSACAELVADAEAMQNANESERKDYARLLFRLQTQATPAHPALVSALLGRRTPSLLRQRIGALLQPPTGSKWQKWALSALFSLSALCLTNAQIAPRLQAEARLYSAYEAMRKAHKEEGIRLFCPDCIQPSK